MIVFGLFQLDSKQHKVKTKDEYWLTFKDERGNTLKMKGEEEDFEKYSIGDEIDVHRLLGQSKLPGG
ncbi:hypothetical protein MUO93_01540 [Candidatus Bathyarchaeota archaeon]|nr:hypothetical protein [Candidatus Bathyarchaeota archaeon]